MEYEKLWIKALELVERNIPVFLMVVLESKGSSPGRQGFKMLVAENEELYGSIGGGIMEFNFVESAKNKLKTGDYSIQYEYVIHEKDVQSHSSGMICSGSQKIALLPLLGKDVEILKRIVNGYGSGTKGKICISKKGIDFMDSSEIKQKISFIERDDSSWIYEEEILINTIYIIGGGHVSLALSRIMKILNFKIVVFDPRKDIETFKNNIYADTKITVSYEDVAGYIPEGDDIYVAIMTHGHVGDETALKNICGKNVHYLGMMGSPKKVSEIYTNLKKQGIDPILLEKVKAPIGLPINSETPEEIAISIAAEIIKISKI